MFINIFDLLLIMDCFNFNKKNKELSELCTSLGFSKVYFLEDFVLIKGKSKKEVLKEVRKAKGKLTIFKPNSEELMRFALEKTKIDIVYGIESINPKDSVHFVRGGLDQIICRIAKDKGKIIGFSFCEILNSKDKARLLARMMFNIKLCKKYKVRVVFSTFGAEIRSAKDLDKFFRLLGR